MTQNVIYKRYQNPLNRERYIYTIIIISILFLSPRPHLDLQLYYNAHRHNPPMADLFTLTRIPQFSQIPSQFSL